MSQVNIPIPVEDLAWLAEELIRRTPAAVLPLLQSLPQSERDKVLGDYKFIQTLIGNTSPDNCLLDYPIEYDDYLTIIGLASDPSRLLPLILRCQADPMGCFIYPLLRKGADLRHDRHPIDTLHLQVIRRRTGVVKALLKLPLHEQSPAVNPILAAISPRYKPDYALADILFNGGIPLDYPDLPMLPAFLNDCYIYQHGPATSASAASLVWLLDHGLDINATYKGIHPLVTPTFLPVEVWDVIIPKINVNLQTANKISETPRPLVRAVWSLTSPQGSLKLLKAGADPAGIENSFISSIRGYLKSDPRPRYYSNDPEETHRLLHSYQDTAVALAAYCPLINSLKELTGLGEYADSIREVCERIAQRATALGLVATPQALQPSETSLDLV